MNVWYFFCGCILLGTLKADICSQLQESLSLRLPGGSRAERRFCRGLYWSGDRGTSHICVTIDEDNPDCPTDRPVTLAEAFALMLETSGMASCGTCAGAPVAAEPAYEIIAFGDWGVPKHPEYLIPTADLIRSWYSSVDAVFLLGDNFYPRGINVSLGVRDPAFNLFSDILAPSTSAKFHVIFGNHDYMGSPDAQIEYSNHHPQWIFPRPYYFKSFRSPVGRICSWFLDTDEGRFDADQARWLNHTLRDEASNCAFLLVNGHHPVYDGGEYRSNQHLIDHLLPILTFHKVHLYIAGHEHQSQILQSPDLPTTFLIAGAISDMRPPKSKGHEFLKFINMKNEAILHLGFFEDKIDFSFIPSSFEKRRRSEPPKPLASGTVYKIWSSGVVV